MKNLTAHIEKLLLTHDCVIIPGLGGFVANYESAFFSVEKNLLTPPARKIGFNIHLTHNDGLLAQELMKQESCSYDSAIQTINKDIQHISLALKNNQQVKIGKLGTLVLTNDNQLAFEPDPLFAFTPQYYGLTPIQCQPLAIPVVQKKPLSKFVFYSAAAIVMFMFLFPISVFDKQKTANEASVLPVNWVNYNDKQTTLNEPVTITENIAVQSDEIMTDSLVTISEEITVNETEEIATTEAPVVIETSKPYKTYHIIIASLPNQSSANKYLTEIEEYAFENIAIVEMADRYRISAKSFTKKSDAESYLTDFKKENPHFASAWICAETVN